jgi:pSer/pThr/pTyr-binding forkhead associated (FHA) protein
VTRRQRGPLLRLSSDHTGVTIVQPGDTVSIGRHRTNDVVIDDPNVSRHHAAVGWPKGMPFPLLSDLGSRNGTIVLNRRVQGWRLRGITRITVGPVELLAELHLPEPTPAPSVVEALTSDVAETQDEDSHMALSSSSTSF